MLILLLIELCVAVALGQIAHVDSPSMDRAYVAWQENPTPQTRQAVDRERRLIEVVRWSFSGGVFATLAGITVFVYRMRRGEPVAPGNDAPPLSLR